MILLTSNSDKMRVVTTSAANIDVHASYMDYGSSVVTPGRKNTAISSATTTDVVESPAASTNRNVKSINIRNRHASTPCTVTVVHTDGATAVELYKAALGPGAVLRYEDGVGFFTETRLETPFQAWGDKIIGIIGNGNPDRVLFELQRAGNVAATPTNIGVSIARCSLFRPEVDITVNRIRYYGVGATTGIYRLAIYRYDDLARLTAELPANTALNAWGSVDAGGINLTAGELYFAAVAVNATGTTPGMAAVGNTVAATTGQVQTAPSGLPGNLAAGANFISQYNFQFPVTAGALPNPAATLVAQAAWAGGFPGLLFDNNTAA